MNKRFVSVVLWSLMILLAYGPLSASAEEAQNQIESTLDFVYYDGDIIYISVKQAARNENTALYASFLDEISFPKTALGAYCEAESILDAEGNEVPISFARFGDAMGETIHSYFYEEMPKDFAPDTLHVPFMTGLVLPNEEALMETTVLTAYLSLDDLDARFEYPLNKEVQTGEFMRLTQYFVQDRLNLFILEHTPRQDVSMHWRFSITQEGKEDIGYNGHSGANVDGTKDLQWLFFPPAETPPEKLICRLMDFSETVLEEFSVDLTLSQ